MRKVIIVIVILALIGAGIYFGVSFLRARAQTRMAENMLTEAIGLGDLTATVGATGSVRANQTANINWQTSGIVDEIAVKVGDEVGVDQLLATLKQDSLPQNVILARSELVEAKKALQDLLLSKLPQAQALKAVEDAQREIDNKDIDLQSAQAQAVLALVTAQDALTEAEKDRKRLDNDRATQATLDAAEADYILAKQEVDRAQKAFNKVAGRKENDPVRALAQAQLSAASEKRDAALRRLNWLKGKPSDFDFQEADAKLVQAQAQLAVAEQEWERLKEGLSPAEVALLDARLEDAQHEYDRLKNGPNADDVAALEARIAATQASLNQASLKAPFSGTITDVQAKPGDQAAPGKAAFRLDDLARLLVDVRITEVDINSIKAGQPVVLTFDAVLGKEYQGIVTDVGRVGEISQGVVEFPVTVELTNPDENVRPGMTAAVNIVTDQFEDVLLVPNRAVRLLDGKRVVYVLENGRLEPREITLGASSETMSQVLSGDIQVGDTVVLNPPAVFEENGPPPFMQR